MKTTIDLFKLLTDEHRVRIMMLLTNKELSVCQLMGITGMSQPLVSRNLSLLYKGGFLSERRDGKLRFYSIKKDLSEENKSVLALLKKLIRNSPEHVEDLDTLKECTIFQKKTGRCDMKTLTEFMTQRKRR